MATMKTVEVWVKVDQDGDYDVGTDAESAAVRYAENIGVDEERGVRMVRLMVYIPLPTSILVEVEVPDTEGVPTVSVG